jgi:cytochrome c oxidase subunit 3
MTETPLSKVQLLTHLDQTPEEELELNRFGMWVFLSSEVLFFGGLFMTYTIYRYLFPDAFAEGSRHLDTVLGSINTAILLTSSFTMALAVNAIQRGQRRVLFAFLLATMILGTIFLGIKGLEYAHKFEEGLFPGASYAYTGPNPEQTRVFFSLYFIITGLHALHMIIGILLIGGLAFLAWRKRFSAESYVPVEIFGLYWHFVDIVWIFVFPLMYLIHPA